MTYLNTEHWAQLTRDGIPAFVVWNTPLTIDGRLLKAGDLIPVEGMERTVRSLFDTNKITTEEKYFGVKKEKQTKKEGKSNGRRKI